MCYSTSVMFQRLWKFAQSPQALRLLLKTSYLGALGLAAVELFFYSGVIRNNLFISPLMVSVAVALFHLWARFRKKQTLGEGFAIANLVFITPLILLLALVMYFLEDGGPMYPNYFFEEFKVDYIALYSVAGSTALLGAVHATKKVFQHYGRVFYVMAMVWALAEAGKFRLRDFGGYFHFVNEDGTVENLTSIAFFVSGILSLLLIRAKTLFASTKRARQIFTGLCIFLAVGFFLVAGEEISWGQRIFGWESSESVHDVNLQGETNLHNHEAIFPYVYRAYAAIGLYGMFAAVLRWVLDDFLPKTAVFRRWLVLLTPDHMLFLNFLMTTVYVRQRTFSGPFEFSMWEELGELLLVSGIMIHLLMVNVYVHTLKKRKDQ